MAPTTKPRAYALSGEATKLYRLADVDGNITSPPLRAIDLAARLLDVEPSRLAWLIDGEDPSEEESDKAFHERNAVLSQTDPEAALAELDERYHDHLPEGANCRLCGIEHAAINPTVTR